MIDNWFTLYGGNGDKMTAQALSDAFKDKLGGNANWTTMEGGSPRLATIRAPQYNYLTVEEQRQVLETDTDGVYLIKNANDLKRWPRW